MLNVAKVSANEFRVYISHLCETKSGFRLIHLVFCTHFFSLKKKQLLAFTMSVKN